MKRIVSVIFLVALIAGTYFVIHRSEFRECEGRIFGTTYHIKYAATHDLSGDIQAALTEVDAALSMFNDTSTLSRFNRGEAFAANPLFDDVMEMALNVSKETDGAFDITVAPLVNAWGFGFKNKDDVTPAQVDSLRQHVGYQLLQFDRKHQPALTRRDSMTTIDCGAIAKGYGVQQVAKMLSQKGCTNYLVEIGGEVVVKGLNPKGEKWTLGISKPVEDSSGKVSDDFQENIRLTDCGVATSGNYRNFYYKDGKKYAHTINPATGYPVEHSLLSATVIHKSCAMADAYATSFMVMGLEGAKRFVATHRDVQAYLIYADEKGQLQSWQSAGFEKYIEK